MPALNSGHTIGHIAAPDLIRRGNRELPVEMVRYFNVFVPAAFVFMHRYLATGDIQLFHQLTGQPSPESDALSADHRGDTSRASRATTGVPDFTDETPFDGTLSVRPPAVFTNVAITASVNTEQPAQWRYRVVRPKTVYYRELFRESDIKSAVVDSIGQRNSYVKTWGCGGFLNETNIYSRGKSLCF